jgi:hypothetical protein
VAWPLSVSTTRGSTPEEPAQRSLRFRLGAIRGRLEKPGGVTRGRDDEQVRSVTVLDFDGWAAVRKPITTPRTPPSRPQRARGDVRCRFRICLQAEARATGGPWTCPGLDDTRVVVFGFLFFKRLFSSTGGAQRVQRLVGVARSRLGEHPEGGVAAPAVVERLDVLQHRGLELEPRWPAAALTSSFLSVAKKVSATALS